MRFGVLPEHLEDTAILALGVESGISAAGERDDAPGEASVDAVRGDAAAVAVRQSRGPRRDEVVVWMPGVLTQFGKTLRELEIRHIQTQVNSPWTNGKIEAFWATLKERGPRSGSLPVAG